MEWSWPNSRFGRVTSPACPLSPKRSKFVSCPDGSVLVAGSPGDPDTKPVRPGRAGAALASKFLGMAGVGRRTPPKLTGPPDRAS